MASRVAGHSIAAATKQPAPRSAQPLPCHARHVTVRPPPPAICRSAQGLSAIVAPVAGLGALFMIWKTGHLGLVLRILSFLCCRPSAAAPQPAAAAPAPAQQPPAGGRKQRGGGRPSPSSSQDGEAGGQPVDGVVRVAKQGQAAGWKKLRVGSVAPDPERQRRRSSSLYRARASIIAAAHQAREMLLGLRCMVSNPLADGGDEEAAAGRLPARVAGPGAGAGSGSGGGVYGGMGSDPFCTTPTFAPMAGGSGGSPFGGLPVRSTGGSPAAPLSPMATPTARAANAGFAAFGSGGGGGGGPSLEQQLRQVQQQRQLLRQLQQVQQQQDSLAALAGGGGAAAAYHLAERAASAPALFLAPLGGQPSLSPQQLGAGWPQQQQQQQQQWPAPAMASSAPGSPMAAAAAAGVLGPGHPLLPPFAALGGAPLSLPAALHHHMSAALLAGPSLAGGVHSAPVTPAGAASLQQQQQLQAAAWQQGLQQQQQQQQQQADALDLSGLGPASWQGALAGGGPQQQQQAAGMHALGLPALEAQQQQQQQLRRLAAAAGAAKSRFAPGLGGG